MTRRAAVVHIVQARTNSRRLPAKVLASIAGHPLLQYAARRARATAIGDVVIATTTGAEDDAVVELGRRLGINVVRGPADDVLERFILVARARPGAAWFVRWTADNAFSDVESAGRLLTSMPPGADYAVEEGLPVGGAVEVMSRTALLRAGDEAVSAYDREHVTPWMKRLPASRQWRPQAGRDRCAPDLRLTVDTTDDLHYVRHLAESLARSGWDPCLAPLPEVIAAARRLAREDVA